MIVFSLRGDKVTWQRFYLNKKVGTRLETRMDLVMPIFGSVKNQKTGSHLVQKGTE